MRVLNTVVFYDNQDEVEDYISEIDSIANGLVDIALIVNNDENNQVADLQKRLFAKGINYVKTINYGSNVGYLNAMLKTIKRIDINEYDYVILSNTDIHYSPLFFQQLAQKEYSEDIGCIAPCIFATLSNSYSNPHYRKRIPKKKLERLVRIFKYPLLGKWYLKLSELKAKKTKAEKKSACYVYSPHGCYMIFTRPFLRKVLGYEYGVKMYSEESAIGELLLKYGLRCYYDDSIDAVHRESSVTGKLDYKRRFGLWRASLQYILDTFYCDSHSMN